MSAGPRIATAPGGVRALAGAALLVAALLAGIPPAHAAASITRAAGTGRVETAVELSRAAFADGSATDAVVASSRTFADALAANPLAGAVGGPLLLTPPDGLPPVVTGELRRLGVTTVHLMGGASTTSEQVRADIEAAGIDVIRYAGVDRFETATLAADAALARWRADGTPAAGDHVIVALGRHADAGRAWPDALAAGALAGIARRPILLVEGGGVPDATRAWIDAHDPARITVVGGTGTIPESVVAQLGDAGTVRTRRGGADRYATAALLATDAIAAGASPSRITVATGGDFPDALAAGAVTIARGGVLLLVHGRDLDYAPAARGWLEGQRGGVTQVVVAGGTGTIAPGTVGQIQRAVDGYARPDLQLTSIATPFDGPVLGVSTAPDGRLHAFTRGGEIWALGGSGWSRVLAIAVRTDGEGGLLGVAYASDGRIFAHYTGAAIGGGLQTRLAEFSPRSTPEATAATERRLFILDQPATNHDGGTVLFAPDGTLLLFLGDGGGADDQFGNGQRSDTPFAAVLRFDVSTPGTAAAPATNPYGGDGRFTWMYGLRNPFRADIDPVTGLLHIADVGQQDWEEVDVVPWDAAGTNFGWSTMEGNHCFRSPSCSMSGLTRPVVEYAHDDGCAITGGQVYRGSIGMLRGHYLYGDFCSGIVRSFRWAGGAVVEATDWTAQLGGDTIWSFGRDALGELYVSRGGALYRIDAAAA